MKRIVAVSGGVDSVVLLHMLVNRYKLEDLVVAHFEHGIRAKESEADARFVEALSHMYGIRFEIGHGHLSSDASEAQAREKRYDFLRMIAKKHEGMIVTAHHKDDLVETIALNLWRGTGWRGLAVFGDTQIERPLLGLTKSYIYKYAVENKLEWVEDETNRSDMYTRNRLRRALGALPSADKSRIIDLYKAQTKLRGEIERETSKIDEATIQSRYFMTMIPDAVALELLRIATKGRITRPGLRQLLRDIKTARPGTHAAAGGGLSIKFTSRNFTVKTTGASWGEGGII
jgi:tRNA(Ile)-lysidine synthase